MPNKYYSITGKNRSVRRKVLSGNSQLIIFPKQQIKTINENT